MRMHGPIRTLIFVLALAILAGARRADAQTGTISGTVTDAANGQPLEGVQIVLEGTGRGAVTAADGRYFLLSVPPGTYTVIARRLGYQTEERRFVQVQIDVTRWRSSRAFSACRSRTSTSRRTPTSGAGSTCRASAAAAPPRR